MSISSTFILCVCVVHPPMSVRMMTMTAQRILTVQGVMKYLNLKNLYVSYPVNSVLINNITLHRCISLNRHIYDTLFFYLCRYIIYVFHTWRIYKTNMKPKDMSQENWIKTMEENNVRHMFTQVDSGFFIKI